MIDFLSFSVVNDLLIVQTKMYDSSNLLLYHLGAYNLSCKLCPQRNEVTSVVQDHKELEAVGYWISLYMRYYDIITPFFFLRLFLFLTWLQRNYRFFYLFISTSTILCIYVFVISLVNILYHGGNLWRAISQDILSDVLIIYCFIAVWFVGGLTIFHFYLISTNQVTSLTNMSTYKISYGSSVISSAI